MIDELRDIGIISANPHELEFYHKGTRDRPDINVLRDRVTDVLILDRIDQTRQEYTERKDPFQQALLPDNQERARWVEHFLTPYSKWVDVGAGSGGLLAAVDHNKKIAVESDDVFRAKLPFESVKATYELPTHRFHIVTLMHVLEHMPDPITQLQHVHRVLHDDGILLVEVPHRKNILIYLSNAFRKFTFWSDHLILFTKPTLEKTLLAAGFTDVRVRYHQRYGVKNFMMFTVAGKPSGRKRKASLLDKLYGFVLKCFGLTDTLIAEARK